MEVVGSSPIVLFQIFIIIFEKIFMMEDMPNNNVLYVSISLDSYLKQLVKRRTINLKIQHLLTKLKLIIKLKSNMLLLLVNMHTIKNAYKIG